METCPVHSFCCLKAIYGRYNIKIPRVPCFVCLPECYGIEGKYILQTLSLFGYPDKIDLKDNY